MKALLIGGDYCGDELDVSSDIKHLKLLKKITGNNRYCDHSDHSKLTIDFLQYRKIDLKFRRNHIRSATGGARFEEMEDLNVFADVSISDKTAKTIAKAIIRALNANWTARYSD